MRDELQTGVVPRSVLTWHEEEARFAFQNGQAAFMRNWPYAYALLQDSTGSVVAGRFAVAPMPAGPGGSPTAALGGAQLAINANSEHPEAAWAVIDYLTRPEQMLERAQVVGQFPARRTGISEADLTRALSIPPAQIRAVVEHAVPRPVTPVYTQLSDILQIQLHRALTRQASPEDALREARDQMQRLLDRVGLGAGSVRALALSPAGRSSARRAWGGPWCSRPSAPSSSSPSFRWPGRSGSRSTCTTSGCPGSAGRSSGSTTISRRWGTRASARRWSTRCSSPWPA